MKSRSISIAILLIVAFTSFFNITGNALMLDLPKSSATIWSNPQVVSAGTSTDSWRPAIVADSENNVHITWGQNDDGDQDLYYRRWNESTRTWTNTIEMTTNSSGWSGGSKLALDEHDNLYLLYVDQAPHFSSGTDSDIYLQIWNKTTGSWLPFEIISNGFGNPSNWPSLFVKNGETYVVWQDDSSVLGSGTDRDIFYRKRAIDGNWGTVELVSTVSGAVSRFPDVTVDNNLNVFVTWDDTEDYNSAGIDQDIFFRMRNSTSEVWEIVEVLSDNGWSATSDVERTKLDIDSTGNVHVIWTNGSRELDPGEESDIFYRQFNQTIDSWASIIVLSPEESYDTFVPSIAIGENDDIFVVWFNGTEEFGNYKDILFKTMNSSTKEWSTLQTIKQESSAWRPDISIGGSNRIHIVFQDDDPNYDGSDQDILYVSGFFSEVTNLTMVDYPDDKTYRIGKTGNVLSWTLADPSTTNPTYSLLKDGTEVLNSTWITYVPIEYNIDGLELGTYNYTLVAVDGQGEFIQDIVYITVKKRGLGVAELQTLLEVGIGLLIGICTIGLTMAVILIRRKRK